MKYDKTRKETLAHWVELKMMRMSANLLGITLAAGLILCFLSTMWLGIVGTVAGMMYLSWKEVIYKGAAEDIEVALTEGTFTDD